MEVWLLDLDPAAARERLEARAVPMPWAETPAAMPIAAESVIRIHFINGDSRIAPRMPVAMTSAAVRKGAPPIRSERPMAMGAVTDLGASDAASRGRSDIRAGRF